MPVGINYNNAWTKELLALLDSEGVHCVDNTDLLIEKSEQDEWVFNREFNSGHWNELGAYYGVNNILVHMNQTLPSVHINTPDEFTVEQKLNETLLVSEFPIHEYEPIYELKYEPDDLTELYSSEVYRNPSYQFFLVTKNDLRMKEGCPRVLVFQGSYSNGMGYKFFKNSFAEYIAVHDYQNVLNIDYYVNLFHPDYVLFEVAEYTLTEQYFSPSVMRDHVLNPSFDTIKTICEFKSRSIAMNEYVTISQGDMITEICLSGVPSDIEYVYAKTGDRIYDLCLLEDGRYSFAIMNADFSAADLTFYCADLAAGSCYELFCH